MKGQNDVCEKVKHFGQDAFVKNARIFRKRTDKRYIYLLKRWKSVFKGKKALETVKEESYIYRSKSDYQNYRKPEYKKPRKKESKGTE